MEIQEHHFPTQKTARYSSYGTASSSTKYFWFVLHGSRMLCEQMLFKFADFDPKEHYVIAPEGLNRFYAKDFGGDVVSSWMTKRDRLEEIADFSFYLSSLYKQCVRELPEGCKKTVLGFSQGGTTMYRWLHADKVEIDHLIAYSCWVPEDIDLKESKTALNAIPSLYTYGLQDQFLTEERIKMVTDIINKNELTPSIVPYEGDHRVDKANLKRLFENYIKG